MICGSALITKTLGSLLTKTRTLIEVPADTDNTLRNLLKKRNYLAHHFFKTNAAPLLSENGRRDMIDELRSVTDEFRKGDMMVEALYWPIWRRFGVTEELIDNERRKAKERAEGEK